MDPAAGQPQPPVRTPDAARVAAVPSGHEGAWLGIPGRWWLVAALLVLARCVALVFSTWPEGTLTGDEPIYDSVARGLLAGHGLTYHGGPWILRPPGWPILLAALYALPTPDRATVVVFQGLCDGIGALAWAWVALTVFRRNATAALVFVALLAWPPFFRESVFIQTDPVYTMLLGVMTAAFLATLARPTLRRAALTGVVAGVTMLVRPPGLVHLGGLLVGWFLWRPREVLRRFAVPAVMVAAALVTISPWAIRNEIVFRRFVPLSLGTGEQFFQGTLLQTEGRFVHGVTFLETQKAVAAATLAAGHPLDVFERDRALLEAGLAQWRAEPGRSATIVLRRAWRLCLVPLEGRDRPVVRFGFLAVLLAIYALGLPRIPEGWRCSDPVRALPGMLGVTLLLSLLAHLPFYTNSRYFEPMRPLLIVFAAETLLRLLGPRIVAAPAPPASRTAPR